MDQQIATKELDVQGYTIIQDFLTPERLDIVRGELQHLLGHYRGRNEFEGTLTERVYTLVARHRTFQDIAEDSRIMSLCDVLLQPNFLLTASQAICIYPGESAQPLHTDDAFYPVPRPRPMVSLSTIVAVDEFTPDNGGTQVIPGSHRWSDAEIEGTYNTALVPDNDAAQATLHDQAISVSMPAGACMVFAGTLLHRGGANRSTGNRLAFSNQYCQPWARTQENFFLSISPEQVRSMSARVQSMLGYSVHPPFMGQVTASHPLKALEPGYVPPVSRPNSSR